MYDWLFEGQVTVYFVLGALFLVLLGVWWQRQDSRLLLPLGGLLILLVVYFLLDRLVETDRKQVERSVRVMAGGVGRDDLNEVFRHISDHFDYHGRDKAALRSMSERYIHRGDVQEIRVWGFEAEGPIARENRTASIAFDFKVLGNVDKANGVPYHCVATFEFDPTRGWLLTGFRLFNPLTNEEVGIPGF